jgi:hypothetical protein
MLWIIRTRESILGLLPTSLGKTSLLAYLEMKEEIDSQRRDPPQISPESDHDQYPEGGLKAWSVVLGAWCAMIPSMGLLNSLGTLQPWTSTHQLKDYSESSIGWIYGTYTFFLFWEVPDLVTTFPSDRMHS